MILSTPIGCADSPSGLPSLGALPYGAHFGQLYRTARDLVDVVVPFLAAGIDNDERCIWITGDPLGSAAARQALRAALPRLDELERCGHLEIVNHDQLAASEVWQARETAALELGYAGLRICESSGCVAGAHESFQDRRILALCCHSLDRCTPSDLIEMLRIHGFALVRQHEAWIVIRSATELLAEIGRQTIVPQRSQLDVVCPTRTSSLQGHDVCFYDDGRFPVDGVTAHLQAAIERGGAAVAIATESSRRALRDALAVRSVDVGACEERQQLVLLDARQTLASIHDGGTLSRARFEAVVAPRIAEGISKFSAVSAFGEMVDLLCRDGKIEQAIELEGYWNALRDSHPCNLLCAYCLSSFRDAGSLQGFAQVCDAHDAVRDGDLPNVDTGRLLVHFEHRSRVLAHEIERRRQLELESRRLLAAERDAAEHARSTHRHLARLQRVTSALSETATTADVCRVARTELADVMEAEQVELAITRQGDPILRLLGRDGAPIGPCAAESPLQRAFEGGRPGGEGGFVALPLLVGTRPIGALGMTLLATAARTPADSALLEDVARQLALALDRAELYEVGRQSRERAERANLVKDEFLAMLGHELRNPLSPMLTALQLMHLRAGDVAVKERAVIERQVRHMMRLVDDLLDISRITRGTLSLAMQPIELAEVVASAIELATPLLEERTHRLTTQVPSRNHLVHADPHRLAQAVANLLMNAAKYTPRGGRLEIRAAPDGRWVRLSVKDNGIGIEPALLPRIFESFVQGRQGIDRRSGGLGLGLAIVRRLVELHGGWVWAESAGRHRGATFTIELPLCEGCSETASPAAPTDAELPESEAAGALRVLVVDDNCDAAEMLAEVLRIDGHLVRIANDGPSALEVAADLAPNVALLDIGLPVMDGFELADLLRQRLAVAPVLLAVTGYGQPTDIARTRAAGFDDHFTKPVDFDRLRGEIRRLERQLAG